MPERHSTNTPIQPNNTRGDTQYPPLPPTNAQRQRTTRAIGVILMAFGIGWLVIALHKGSPAPAEADVPISDKNQLISQTYPTRNIALDISSGSITIGTWDQDTTEVQAFYQGGETDDYDVQPHTQGDTLTIQGGPKAYLPVSGDRQISYHITIPQEGSVNIKNVIGDASVVDVNGPVTINLSTGDIQAKHLGQGLNATTTTGNIQIEDLSGPLAIQSTTGSITLEDGNVQDANVATVAGDINLAGVGGKVTLENSTGTIRVSNANNTILSIHTVSGDIDFNGALATKAKHTLNTVSGRVNMHIPEESDLVLHTDTSSGNIDIEGDLKLQKPEISQFSKSGVLGSGGAELEISTVSGNISVAGG